MSTQRPQPELSAYFIREKRILKAADTGKYNTRLKEIDLPDDYAIYGYEPSSGRKPAAYWVCKQSVGKCPECGTPYLEDAIASVSESKLTHYCRVEIPHEGPTKFTRQRFICAAYAGFAITAILSRKHTMLECRMIPNLWIKKTKS